MFKAARHILPSLLVVLSLLSCDRTPRGVMSVREMSDLIVDLQIADAYIDGHTADYPDDSTRQVMKQSIFKKHGITSQDYDSSLVWYSRNMEDYIKAHNRALTKLKERHEKLEKEHFKNMPSRLEPEEANGPLAGDAPRGQGLHPQIVIGGARGDTVDLWKGSRRYLLTGGARRGFIPFDLLPDAGKQAGDCYQLAYKLLSGGNGFKVSLNVDYTDGSTSQIARSTGNDGWATITLQSDTARQVRRVYGYVSYDMQRGSMACVDSLSLMRTPLDRSRYSHIHAQRELKRK